MTGDHDQKRDHKETLVLRLELFEKRLCITAVGGKIRRNNVHIVPGTDRFFLFFDLRTVQFRDLMLDHLERRILVKGTDMDRYDLSAFHIQKILEHHIGELGCNNVKVRHCAVAVPHLEVPFTGEIKGIRCNEILNTHPFFSHVFPAEAERYRIRQMEHGMHDSKPFRS